MDDDILKKNNIKEKFRVLTETSPDCIKLFDTNGNLLYINPGGLREHNLKSLDDALNKNWQAIETLIEKDRLKFKKALEDALNNKISTIEVEHTKGGSIRDFCLETIAPVKDADGDIVGIFGVSRDITELKKTQNELNKIKNELENMIGERTQQLNEKIQQLEKTNKIMVGRELEMIEMKERIRKIEAKNNSDD